MIELSIIKLFTKDKSLYLKYNDIVSKIAKEKEIKVLYNLIAKYYSCFEEHDYISKDELVTLYAAEYPMHKAADKELYNRLLDTVFNLETSRDMAQDLISSLVEKDFANTMAQALLPIALGQRKGKGFDHIKELLNQYEDFEGIPDEEDVSPFFEDSLEDLLVQTESDGLEWRLTILRNHLGPLIGGTLGHIFARPEQGKTSFLHSEVTFLAPQLEDDSCILWFNNEEAASRVKLRWYCAMAGMTEQEVKADPKRAADIFRQNGGRRLHLVDEANISIDLVNKLCNEYKPRLVVIDQGDKVSYKGDNKAGNGADRLKAVYDKLRETVKRCNKEWKMDILTVGQADVQAENKRRLFQSNLDGGKTGKAGAFDYILGIGGELDKDSARYISFCKNKIKGYHGVHMVGFDRFKGRYSD